MSQLQFAAHADESAHRPAGARTTHGAKAELSQNAGDVLAIEAAADHHRHLLAAKSVAGGNHAAMPKAPNPVGRSPAVAQAIRLADNSEAQGGAKPADEQVSRPGDQPQGDPLAQSESTRVDLTFDRGFDLRSRTHGSDFTRTSSTSRFPAAWAFCHTSGCRCGRCARTIPAGHRWWPPAGPARARYATRESAAPRQCG